jgi:hypothetical protein
MGESPHYCTWGGGARHQAVRDSNTADRCTLLLPGAVPRGRCGRAIQARGLRQRRCHQTNQHILSSANAAAPRVTKPAWSAGPPPKKKKKTQKTTQPFPSLHSFSPCRASTNKPLAITMAIRERTQERTP